MLWRKDGQCNLKSQLESRTWRRPGDNGIRRIEGDEWFCFKDETVWRYYYPGDMMVCVVRVRGNHRKKNHEGRSPLGWVSTKIQEYFFDPVRYDKTPEGTKKLSYMNNNGILQHLFHYVYLRVLHNRESSKMVTMVDVLRVQHFPSRSYKTHGLLCVNETTWA